MFSWFWVGWGLGESFDLRDVGLDFAEILLHIFSGCFASYMSGVYLGFALLHILYFEGRRNCLLHSFARTLMR